MKICEATPDQRRKNHRSDKERRDYQSNIEPEEKGGEIGRGIGLSLKKPSGAG